MQEFSLRRMDNILTLHYELVNGTYRHGGYYAFNISDPKPRNIHKANVRDRLVHHAIHRVLYPEFDKVFIADSYSCRLKKGTHAAIERFERFGHIVSKNNTRTCWVLKGDIRKFFASINHGILLEILRKHISNNRTMDLLEKVIESFSSTRPGLGLPLGNLTSQLLVNIYMNEFDQFIKQTLKIKYYIRYADDFVILSESRSQLEVVIPVIDTFLREKLQLTLHPNKISIRTIASGADFLGWIQFPDHRVLRTTTKRRMLKRIAVHGTPETLASYEALIRHGNTQKLREEIFGGRG